MCFFVCGITTKQYGVHFVVESEKCVAQCEHGGTDIATFQLDRLSQLSPCPNRPYCPLVSGELVIIEKLVNEASNRTF